MQITAPITKIQSLLSVQKTGKKTSAEKPEVFSQIFEKMRVKKHAPTLANKSAAGTEKAVKKTTTPVIHTDKPVKIKNKDETSDATEQLVALVSNPVMQVLSEVKSKKKDSENPRAESAIPMMKEDKAQESIVLKDVVTDTPKTAKAIAETVPLTKSTTVDVDEMLKKRVAKEETNPAPQEQQPTKKPEKSNRISLRDLRSEIVPDNTRQSTDTVSLHQTQQTATANSQSDLMLDLRSNVTSSNLASNATEFTQTNQFETVLAQELQGKLSGDIVRQAQIVLKNGDSGIIRLSLKPESLGTVKVHLEMVENKLIGHILVENTEVLRAFEREIHSLEQAFRDSGFQTAHLDTRLAGGNQNGAGNGQQHNTGQFFSERLAAVYDSFEPEASSITETLEMQQINVLV